jgi:hypothetical protein
MLMHPEMMLTLAHDRHRELVAEADRERLLSLARVTRRSRKARGRSAGAPAREPSAVAPAH